MFPKDPGAGSWHLEDFGIKHRKPSMCQKSPELRRGHVMPQGNFSRQETDRGRRTLKCVLMPPSDVAEGSEHMREKCLRGQSPEDNASEPPSQGFRDTHPQRPGLPADAEPATLPPQDRPALRLLLVPSAEPWARVTPTLAGRCVT